VDSLIRTHIEGTPLGRRPLRDVRPSEMQAWVTGRSKVLAPLTLRNLVTTVRSIFAGAVADRLIASSPCVRLSLPSARRERLVPLTVDQVRQLAAAVPPRNRAMVIAQAGMGLRIGELLALREEDVKLDAVRIEWQIAPGETVRCRPKTPTSRRTIPLPQFVAAALNEHRGLFPPAEDGTLFTTRFGAPYSHAYYGAQIFKKAVKATPGVPDSTTPHSLRHHYASVLLLAGESVIAVAERLGHENASLVLSTYGHLMPDSEDRTRRALDDAWSAGSATDQARTRRQL
jgi:integrase